MAQNATAHSMLVFVGLGEGAESSVASSGVNGLVEVGLAYVHVLGSVDGMQSRVCAEGEAVRSGPDDGSCSKQVQSISSIKRIIRNEGEQWSKETEIID